MWLSALVVFYVYIPVGTVVTAPKQEGFLWAIMIYKEYSVWVINHDTNNFLDMHAWLKIIIFF